MTLRIGEIAPYDYRMRATFTEVDITTSTSATIRLRNGSGVTVWTDVEIVNRTTTTVEGVTTYSVDLIYVRVPNDLKQSGSYVVVGVLVGPFGELKTKPRDRYVWGEFQTSR